ncbi:hypothetical protein GIB67_014812 [Kingdonia uniflora]|uniref:DUF4283 domain-containing protein n=1 Tax=Kingdonia uniflora TaxID=39325 RepID=A0A7J7NWG2_9MAGN|nr:hypothetical protein GIB67_014812 [Kingdonia uniflora]
MLPSTIAKSPQNSIAHNGDGSKSKQIVNVAQIQADIGKASTSKATTTYADAAAKKPNAQMIEEKANSMVADAVIKKGVETGSKPADSISEERTTGNNVDYASIVRDTYACKGKCRLEFHEPEFNMDKGKFVIKCPKEILEEGMAQWKDTITGFFVGSERDKVLEDGPWHLAGKYFVVQKWDPFSSVDVSKIQSIPIRVKLINLPKHCWTAKALGYIASAIGKPICLDNATETKQEWHLQRSV